MGRRSVPRNWTQAGGVAGTFAYSPAAGTVLKAGSQTLSVTFTPADPTSYNTASGSATLTVNQAMPAVTWATPAAITYGTKLTSAQFDAASAVAGAFTYSPALGTVLGAGTQTLTFTFTPTDATDYAVATGSVMLTVNQAAPTFIWATPAAITYGTALSSTQLDATASVGGSFVYSPVAGTVPPAGSDSITVTFTPTDAVDYDTVHGNVTLTVNKATPVITWATPAGVSTGTALSATQLDATASWGGNNVAGTFVYTPPSGTVMNTNGTQTLSV